MQTIAEAWILGEDWGIGTDVWPSPIEPSGSYLNLQAPQMPGMSNFTLVDCATASAVCMSTYCTTRLGSCIGTKGVCGC